TASVFRCFNLASVSKENPVSQKAEIRKTSRDHRVVSEIAAATSMRIRAVTSGDGPPPRSMRLARLATFQSPWPLGPLPRWERDFGGVWRPLVAKAGAGTGVCIFFHRKTSQPHAPKGGCMRSENAQE